MLPSRQPSSLNPLHPLQSMFLDMKEKFDALSHYKKDAMRRAMVMLFCMSLLLSLFYSQRRVYIYADPHESILKSVSYDTVQDFAHIDDMWPWLLGLLASLGGDTFKHIEANCGPNGPSANSQSVVIDGKTYTLQDPDLQTSSCSSPEYVSTLPASPVILTGNFQLLLLGLFTERAHPAYPNSHSLARNLDTTMSVYNDYPKMLSAMNDWNIVRLCDAPWTSSSNAGGPTVSTQCVLEDNFGQSVGSTLGWVGAQKNLDGQTRHIFDMNSSITARLNSVDNFTAVYPCYSSSVDSSTGEEVVIAGNPYYSFGSDADKDMNTCAFTWLSTGPAVRSFCLDSSGTQPSALQRYTAAEVLLNTTTDMLDEYFSCSKLEKFTADELANVYVKSELALDRHIGDYFNGVFIPVGDEHSFVIESYRISTLLLGHDFVDSRKTRTFRLNMLLRNVESESMFYTMLHCDIKVNANGNVRPSFTMTHVPIIEYVYGSGKYPWMYRQVVILESIMLLFFGLFFLRELHQLSVRLLKVWKKIQYQRRTITPFVPGARAVSNLQLSDVAGDIELDGGIGADSTPNVGESSKLNPTVDVDLENGESNDNQHNGEPCVETNVEGNTDLNGDEFQGIVTENTGDNAFSPHFSTASFVDPDKGTLFYDLVDWTTIVCFIIAIVFRVLYVLEAVSLHSKIKTGLSGDTVEKSLDAIIDQFNHLENLYRRTNFLALFLCFVGFAQFFRYLSFDRRLGIVTKTMTDSFVDLLPVMLIYMFIMMAYGTLGVALYGHELQYFETLRDSLTTLSLIVLGEVAGPYYDMYAVAGVETIFFYWSFVILIGFVLLNMVLAVIFKVYDDVYGAIASEKKSE